MTGEVYHIVINEGYLINVVVMALAGRSLDMVEPNPIHGLIIIMI